MSKKYLSLDEAASMLGMPREEITRLREKGELRGFADRGTWKFKVEDIETLGRSRQADSDPEVPMMLGSESDDALVVQDEDDVLDLFADEAEAPEDSSADRDLLSNSDSDVRLILDDELADVVNEEMGDSDSDVKLVGDAGDSDSDVKLADDATVREINMPDSDSDVKLALPGDKSDSAELEL
ncbi:MAG TPA: helix-turn-helix domain-containing protein, partial [Caulifigura sp.]|nr:helix-turn-helix domain-containing protein [Caulifigura sp.]